MATGAEVVFKSMCFEMHGLEHEVRSAVSTVLELDVIKVRVMKYLLVIFYIFFRRSIMKFVFKLNYPTNTASLSVGRKMARSIR